MHFNSAAFPPTSLIWNRTSEPPSGVLPEKESKAPSNFPFETGTASRGSASSFTRATWPLSLMPKAPTLTVPASVSSASFRVSRM